MTDLDTFVAMLTKIGAPHDVVPHTEYDSTVPGDDPSVKCTSTSFKIKLGQLEFFFDIDGEAVLLNLNLDRTVPVVRF